MYGGNKKNDVKAKPDTKQDTKPDTKCLKPIVSYPLSKSSWDDAFNKLNCYWKQEKIDGIIPKMGGLQMINKMNNNINMTSASLNGFYQNMKRASAATDATISAKIKSIGEWGAQPI